MASCTKAWEGFALQTDTEPSCLEHSDLIPTAWQTAPHRGTALQQAAQNRAGEWGKELLGGPALPWLFHPAVDESCTEPERKKNANTWQSKWLSQKRKHWARAAVGVQHGVSPVCDGQRSVRSFVRLSAMARGLKNTS